MSYPSALRTDWATRTPSFGDLHLPVRRVFAHHTAGPYMPTFDVPSMRAAEEAEVGRGGYVALAYHELFAGDGYQIQSRPLTKMGGATINNNSTSIAICIPGDYSTPNAMVSWAQNASIIEWLTACVAYGVLTSDFELHPHSDVFATACPGKLRDNLAGIREAVGVSPKPPVPPAPAPAPPGDVNAFLAHLAQAVTETRRFLVMGAVVSLGTHNDSAWTVQIAVNAWTPGTLVVDSDYGPKTRSAVISYQTAHHLKADGIVGRKTYDDMYPE